MRFRIMVGQHIQNGPDGREYLYHAGNVVESSEDLAASHNGAGMSPKFVRTNDPATPHFVPPPRAKNQDLERDSGPAPQPTAPVVAERKAEKEFVPPAQTPPHLLSGPLPMPVPVAATLAQTAPGPKAVKNTSLSQDDGLDGLDVQDLQKLAQEEEIDVRGLSKKPELIQAIRSAMH